MCALPLVLGGCIREDEYDNSPTGNFEALWKLIDEHYCFLDYKQIDWDSIYNVYSRQITDDMVRTIWTTMPFLRCWATCWPS